MNKRQRTGQHFLRSGATARKIVGSAGITSNDVVLEVGTGRGVLTPLLCACAGRVVSIESDAELYAQAVRSMAHIRNLQLVCGDGFVTRRRFTVFVSNLPYSQSRRAIEWLMMRDFSHAVIMTQREFAEKLMTDSPQRRRAITVLARHAFEIRKLMSVGPDSFDPPPAVSSVLLELRKKHTPTRRLMGAVNQMFSYRRKTLQNILGHLGVYCDDERRLDEVTGEEILRIARRIPA